MSQYPLILASKSPRRAALLRQIGLHFEVVESGIEEPGRLAEETVPRWVERCAAAKARVVAREHSEATVVGADTVVVVDGCGLGKPRDSDDAARMLSLLGGRSHHVLTGLAVTAPGLEMRTGHECTKVALRTLRPDEIDAYVRSREPMDKAGAYGIQGRAAVFVTRVVGCYFNVVGLPLALLAKMLEDVGVRVDREW